MEAAAQRRRRLHHAVHRREVGTRHGQLDPLLYHKVRNPRRCSLKPGPHQQQCRSNIVECYNVELVLRWNFVLSTKSNVATADAGYGFHCCLSVCLSVCFSAQKPMQLGSPNLPQIYTRMSPGNQFISMSKSFKGQGHESRKHCRHGSLHSWECSLLPVWLFRDSCAAGSRTARSKVCRRATTTNFVSSPRTSTVVVTRASRPAWFRPSLNRKDDERRV